MKWSAQRRINYEDGTLYQGYRRQFYYNFAAAGLFSQSILVVVYRLCRPQSSAIGLHEVVPHGNISGKAGRTSELPNPVFSGLMLLQAQKTLKKSPE